MSKVQPPSGPTSFLKWICKEEFQEEILGDLEETYGILLENHSENSARKKYWIHTLKFLRWSNLKTPKIMSGINFTLFRKSIRFSIKQYRQYFGHSFLNSLGLAIGISTFITLAAFTYHQFIYDKSFDGSESIFRLVTERKVAESNLLSATSAVPLLPAVANGLSEIQHTVRMYPYPCFVRVDKLRKYRESSFIFADSSLFDVFNFKMVKGNPRTALSGPLKVVLTQKMSIKYFGDRSPIGQRIKFEDTSETHDFEVTGVIENLPENTHLKADFFASMQSLDQIMPWYNNWHYPQMYSYVKLKKADTTDLTNALAQAINARTPEYYHSEVNSIKFQGIESIHLQSKYEGDWKVNSSLIYVQIFVIVGILILVISIVNYVNLVISKGVVRTKEVGMRKVMGANKGQLTFQFMTEASMNVIIASVLSLGLIKIFTAVLNQNMGITLDFGFLIEWPFNAALPALFIIVVVLAGFYPSWIMSGYRPLDSFRQKLPNSGSSLLRKGLVLFQFAISSTMILVTLLILVQSQFLQSKNLGFDQSHLVAIKMLDDNDAQNYDVLKNKLTSESFIKSVTVSSTLPGKGGFYDFKVSSDDLPDLDPFDMKTLGVDEDFMSTYDMRLKSGRDFDKSINSDDTAAFIINQAAADKFGWDDPVGRPFKLTIYTGREENRVGKVIGLTEDFHFESLYKKIEPVVLYINKHPHYTDFLTVNLEPGNLPDQIKRLETIYASFNPNKPFQFSFVDDELDKHYENEIQQGNMMTLFSGIAIILSCLGILGLITYSTARKTREVGIRKIMGSGRFQIFYLFIKEYIQLFIPAIILSAFAVYFFAENWLSNFAYSISFNAVYYFIGFISLAMITLLTVSYHTLRASMLNPVDCLKNE